VRTELTDHSVRVLVATAVTGIVSKRHDVHVSTDAGHDLAADLVVVAVGVVPNTAFGRRGGLPTGIRDAFVVDRRMATAVPHVWAAGYCVETWLPLLNAPGYLPLGTTAYKQGRVAGTNAVGGDRLFTGALGTQVVQVFELAVARTGLRVDEAARAGYQPRSSDVVGGAQILGRRSAQVAKRIDSCATAIHSGLTVDAINDLDLSYTPPYGSPWDPVQTAAQAWTDALG
jgi:NADPH-dependent 2,4-dienoyl-CoA reductase/sulfur reductase-like enzyme